MTNKLTTAQACAILLTSNSHLCEIQLRNRKRTLYSIIQNTHLVGYITPKQFEEMINTVLIERHSSRSNKYGDHYTYYVLARGEK